MSFNEVLKSIERMGAYDPLIIKDKRFFKIGWITCCNAHLELDKDIFREGIPHQHPHSNSYWKIKQISANTKYTYILTE